MVAQNSDRPASKTRSCIVLAFIAPVPIEGAATRLPPVRELTALKPVSMPSLPRADIALGIAPLDVSHLRIDGGTRPSSLLAGASLLTPRLGSHGLRDRATVVH